MRKKWDSVNKTLNFCILFDSECYSTKGIKRLYIRILTEILFQILITSVNVEYMLFNLWNVIFITKNKNGI